MDEKKTKFRSLIKLIEISVYTKNNELSQHVHGQQPGLAHWATLAPKRLQ